MITISMIWVEGELAAPVSGCPVHGSYNVIIRSIILTALNFALTPREKDFRGVFRCFSLRVCR